MCTLEMSYSGSYVGDSCMIKIRKDPEEGVGTMGTKKLTHLRARTQNRWLNVEIGGEGEGTSEMAIRFPFWCTRQMTKLFTKIGTHLGENRFGADGEVSASV